MILKIRKSEKEAQIFTGDAAGTTPVATMPAVRYEK